MSERTTISVFELFKMIPDQESARLYLEGRLWPNGPICPVCAKGDRLTVRKDGFYRCNACREDFTVRTGTIFERSHIPLNKWIYAMYLMVTARKGISSLQLAKEIGVTQKSAWFMLHRLREACGGNWRKLRGIIEVDETYVGGKEVNKHASKRLSAGRGTVGKAAVLAMRERGGRTIGMAMPEVNIATVGLAIHANIEHGSTLHTDESAIYSRGIRLFYGHETINHTRGQYRRGNVTTNGIESVFAVLKRGIIGVYHQISAKHIGRYVQEFSFRLNKGNVTRQTVARLDSFIAGVAGKRLTYAGLIR